MASNIVERVYNGRDNTIDLILTADGEVVDLSSVQKMVVEDKAGGFSEIDSDSAPAAFDWNTGTPGKVVLSLGAANVPAGNYNCRIVVFDATTPDGIVWDDLTIAFFD